jgi:hypothetical protein
MEIDGPTNQALALWAADCAERVLNLFEAERPQDDRPRKAINAARAWQLGMINVTEARATAFAAHAAARETTTSGSRAAARAAGHAVATAHVATHARYAARYTVTAATKAASASIARATGDLERVWQEHRLADHLRQLRGGSKGF